MDCHHIAGAENYFTPVLPNVDRKRRVKAGRPCWIIKFVSLLFNPCPCHRVVSSLGILQLLIIKISIHEI